MHAQKGGGQERAWEVGREGKKGRQRAFWDKWGPVQVFSVLKMNNMSSAPLVKWSGRLHLTKSSCWMA